MRLLSHFFLRKNHETKPIAIQIDPFEFRQYLKCIQLVKLCSKNLNRTAVISYLLQNCKKGKPGEMDLPLLKNDITGSEPTVNILDT